MATDSASRSRLRNKPYRLIDLFSGAGGMTLGFTQTKWFKSVFANDFNEYAVDTYNANFDGHCVGGDINALLENPKFKLPKADVVVGGPPCQGFSLLNKEKANDPRKQLWIPYMEVVRRVRPIAFVMENVPELLKSPEFDRICTVAIDLGYRVVAEMLNAADYGVAQRRRRAFIIGCRVGSPKIPLPTHTNSEKSNDLFNRHLQPWRTVRDAIGDLPEPEGTKIRVGEIPAPLDLHFGRNPTRKSITRYKCIPEGGNRVDLQRKRRDLTPRCWINKKGGTDLFGRLWWDKPAFTIRTEFFKPEKGRYLHPKSHRPMTHREAARLMSFPDNFTFKGSKIEVGKQIGNAVPPLLARRVAESVSQVIRKARKPKAASAS